MSQLENLPTEVLQKICENVEDISALALSSKRCLSVAHTVLCSFICIRYSTPGALHADVKKWTSRLNQIGFQYTRCLELKMAHVIRPSSDAPPDPAQEDLNGRWQYLLDSDQVIEGNEQDQEWQPVADLIKLLPGLVKVSYSCQPQFAPCLLRATESKVACRLYLNVFSLRSLTSRTLPSLQAIDITPYEIKLATSPSLYGITSTRFEKYDESGCINFTDEAALSMTAGIAPNLKEVSLRFQRPSSILAYWNSRDMPPTLWQGTEFGRKLPKNSRGALHCLELSGVDFNNVETLQKWAHVTDFSKLKILKLRDFIDASVMRWLVHEVDLLALHTLVLRLVPPEDDEVAEIEDCFLALARKLPPLHTLQVSGDCRDCVLTKVLQIHGQSLQRLDAVTTSRSSIGRYDEINRASKRWYCPALKELAIPIHRTNGDKQEVQQYRWIGNNFPNVRRIFLVLYCHHLGPEVDLNDQAHNRGREFHRMPDGKVYNLQYVLQNHAVDSNLAKAIYHCISTSKPKGSPRVERLELRCLDNGETASFPKDFWKTRKYGLRRHWVCIPVLDDDQSYSVRTKEVFPESEKNYRNDKEKENRYADIDEGAMKIFHSVWPEQPGRHWRDSWHSFPLEIDDDEESNQRK